MDLTANIEYESLTAAADAIDGDSSGVRDAIESKRLYKGHAFWWADDPNPPDIGEFTKSRHRNYGCHVLDLTTGIRHRSMAAAAESLDGKGPSVRDAIESKRLYKGHAFWWADDPNPPDIGEFRESRAARPVMDLTANIEYESLTAAADAIDGDSSGIGAAMEAKRLYKGHAFCYADNLEIPEVSEFRTLRRGRPIVDFTEGVEYESSKVAAESVGGVGSSLIRAMKNMRLYKGHAFWWADDPNPPDLSEFHQPIGGGVG